MERFVQAIEQSIASKNWYAALTLSLTLPDICGRLEDPSLRSQARFEKWFNDYMLPHYESPFHGEGFTFLSGADCYALRCVLLHEGRENIERQRAREVVSKFMFSTTGSHRCQFETVLVLNLQAFCTEICEGVRKWRETQKDNVSVKEAIEELLLIRTEGFSPIPGVHIS